MVDWTPPAADGVRERISKRLANAPVPAEPIVESLHDGDSFGSKKAMRSSCHSAARVAASDAPAFVVMISTTLRKSTVLPW